MNTHCESVSATEALAANLFGLAVGMAMITSLIPALVVTLRMLN
ncbi:MAG TPA: hypothetical protein VGC26_01085 [Afipia sp.]